LCHSVFCFFALVALSNHSSLVATLKLHTNLLFPIDFNSGSLDEFRGTVQFLDKKTEGSAPKKTVKVTTPAVEVASDFDDDICRKQIYYATLLSASFV
jgi:hypothetical protein